jgi:hypothetical protein
MKRILSAVGVGIGVGAAIGAALNGGRGAAVGAAGGAAAGAGTSLAERGEDVILPAGFEVRFRTKAAQEVELAPPPRR